MENELICFAIFNWGLPLLLWLYPLVAWLLFDDIRFDGFYGPFVRFKLHTNLDSWHSNLWDDWHGVGLYWFMIYRGSGYDQEKANRTIIHEGTHVIQFAILGMMFFSLYMGHMLLISVFSPQKHIYLDCWAERQARKRAGQVVDVKREDWPDGPNDRNPWW